MNDSAVMNNDSDIVESSTMIQTLSSHEQWFRQTWWSQNIVELRTANEHRGVMNIVESRRSKWCRAAGAGKWSPTSG